MAVCGICVTLLLVGVIAALIYIYLVWNFGYWKRRGIKEAKSWPVVGSFPSQFTQKRNLAYDVDELYQQYKHDENFVGVFSARSPQFLVLSPELFHTVFVNDFKYFHDNEFTKFIDQKKDAIFANNPFILTGELWKERRAEVTPGLSTNRISAVYAVTQKVCKSFAKYLEQEAQLADGKGIDAKAVCLRYTTEVVSDCVLGIKANSFTDTPSPIYGMTKRVFDQSYIFILFTSIANLVPIIRKIYMPPFFARDVANFFVQLMRDAVDLRRKTPGHEQRVDFLNYMLHLQDKKNLSAMELTSHTMTFLTDGFETTASVLAHTLLLLGRNPAEQQRLREEFGEGEMSFDALSELKYVEAVIHETIRIFSPQLLARKLCTEAYEFTNKNGQKVTVEPGQTVLLPLHSVQHDPDIFEQPEQFKPERFLEENGGVRKWRNRGAYLGFGDGPRVCLGQRFATTQIKAALVEILRNFNIKVNARTRTDNVLDDTFFMAQLKGGIFLDFEKRK